jgi:hypothetical protein
VQGLNPDYRQPVGWLRCFRGIDTLTAMLILAERHDFRRFGSARALIAFLGSVPGEASSAEKHRRMLAEQLTGFIWAALQPPAEA